MNVILEGPDGGGKSTLAEVLATALGTRVQQGSGPPRASGEIERRLTEYLKTDGVVFDRHPAVSQMVYGAMRGETPSSLELDLRREFYDRDDLRVYCRSTSGARHVVKPGEAPAHVETLTRRYASLVEAYDAWAVAHAHLLYRIGDDVDEIVGVIRWVVDRRRLQAVR